MKSIKNNVGDSENRYRMDDELAISLGLTVNKSRRYRMSDVKVDQLKDKVNRTPRLLVYDIETSRALFKGWWTGKRYVGYQDMVAEPKVISIAYKWLGKDEVYTLKWDMETHCDKEMIREFMEVFNSADVLIGQNNDRFDNRWVVGRAIKYGFRVNNFVRSFDIMKQMKKVARIPSYSMGFMTKWKGVELKQSHEGIHMWDMIEDGTPEQQAEYMEKMLEYNRGDIKSTEEMYHAFKPYFGSVTHVGVLLGRQRYTCPSCGSDHVSKVAETVTPAGTVQYIMECQEEVCKTQYKISNTVFKQFA